MIKNHLRLAVRNLLKRKGYSSLNILGLAIGMTCCLLIFQHVAREKGYESFNPAAQHIVRVRMDNIERGKLAWQSATVYPGIGPAMKKEFPEVEDFCRLIDANFLLTNDANHVKIREEHGYFAEPSVIGMLGVEVISGSPATALDGPYKIMLSQSMAKKYFGSENPLGRRLTATEGHQVSLEVTGVFKDYPANSHLVLNHLVSYSTLGQEQKLEGDTQNSTETSWDWYDFYTYIKLRPGADYKALQAKLPAFMDEHLNKREWNVKNNDISYLYLIPMTDIHLSSNVNQEAEVNGNGRAVGFLFLIAFFIIVIAWVNYTNLATSRSLERAKEVGVRKVMGALRYDLVMQFLTESFLLNLLALLIALLAALLLARPFSELVGSQIAQGFSLPATYAIGFAGLFLAGTLLSGAYPAFVLSGYQPMKVLKGLFRNSTQGQLLRKTLIVGQFAVSVILIAGTILVYQQVRYMRNQSLGANIDQTLVLEGARAQKDSVYRVAYESFKTELLRQSDVASVTASSNVMGQEIYWTNSARRLGENSKSSSMFHLAIDEDFISAYKIRMVAGRNFSKEFADDNRAIILNERGAEVLGFANAAEAIGQKIKRGGDTSTVIGVIANYHHQGLQRVIDPMIIVHAGGSRSCYSVKITGHPQKVIAGVEKLWKRYFPDDPFSYFFLDESFSHQYQADIRFGKVFGMFAMLAVLIACFGLLGLSAYNVVQRTKEIGVRKVLGASVQHLIFTLSREFLHLVLISLVIAVPITWWVMHSWLQDFAYRINIEWWVFLVSGVMAVIIAMVTVGFQALKAALASPVKSLRTE